MASTERFGIFIRSESDIIQAIDRNCDVLPLLKFCTNKPILASLLRQFFLGGGRGRFAQKKGVSLLLRAITDFREKKFSASSIRIVSYCKYDTYFNKYDIDLGRMANLKLVDKRGKELVKLKLQVLA
jgi:hypothetical protein